jgi:hypothetical protein
MEGMKVGQKIYLRPFGNKARYSNTIEEATITKIGRKYFEAGGSYGSYGRFYIDNLMHDNGQYVSNYKAYLSIEEIEQERESKGIWEKLRQFYFNSSKPQFSLTTLRKIDELIQSEISQQVKEEILKV